MTPTGRRSPPMRDEATGPAEEVYSRGRPICPAEQVRRSSKGLVRTQDLFACDSRCSVASARPDLAEQRARLSEQEDAPVPRRDDPRVGRPRDGERHGIGG